MFNEEFYKNIYLNGISCFRKKDLVRAKYWFKMACDCPKYYEVSLAKLVNIYCKEGNFRQAREILDSHKCLDSFILIEARALLESVENNFSSSIDCYRECLENDEMKNSSMLSLARIDIQLGKYESGIKKIENLRKKWDIYVGATFELIFLKILEQNYHDAYNLLLTIDKSKINEDLFNQYNIMEVLLLIKLGKINLNKELFNKYYLVRRMMEDDEEELLNHIKRHLDQKNKNGIGCFLEDIDLKKLIIDVKNKIQMMNGNHFETSDKYKFSFEDPIGYKNGELTHDICVVTFLGSNRIVTMYPIELSCEFDKEGFSKNSDIAKKRI